MRILILADANSIHTKRWCYALQQKGLQIAIWTLSQSEDDTFYNKIQIFTPNLETSKENILKKLKYLLSLYHLKKTIKIYNPEVIHAHYLSSYGLLGALLNPKNYIISVWGSDIFRFPKKNYLYKLLIVFSLKRAYKICSTSEIMSAETQKYTNKKISVIPFGIDLKNFFPQKKQIRNRIFRIGTIKSLEKIYGIDVLIRAFNVFDSKYPEIKKELIIVGKGSQENKLKELVNKYNLADKVVFTGPIKHSEVPSKLKTFDLFCALSREESFGVAVIEAQASGIPVLVSNAPGFREIVKHGITGYIVPRESYTEAAKAMYVLQSSYSASLKMTMDAIKNVEHNYNWDLNIEKMISVYAAVKYGNHE